MALTITQTCDPCGRTRTLETVEAATRDGWREVGTRAKNAVFCPTCLQRVVDDAHAAAELRAEAAATDQVRVKCVACGCLQAVSDPPCTCLLDDPENHPNGDPS